MTKFKETGQIIREETTIALAALASKTALPFGDLNNAMVEDFRILKSEVVAFIDGLTANEADDIYLGIANGELTAAEIAEAIVMDGPLNRNDRLLTERSMRFVKIFASLELKNPATDVKGAFVDRSNSAMMVIKPRWTFANPDAWNWFIFNNGTALTTGSSVRLIASSYGLWVV